MVNHCNATCFASRKTLVQDDDHVPSSSIAVFTELLQLHESDSELDVQVIPATVLWGRKPGKENTQKPYLQAMNGLEIKSGSSSRSDCLVRFNPWYHCATWRTRHWQHHCSQAGTRSTYPLLAPKASRVWTKPSKPPSAVRPPTKIRSDQKSDRRRSAK